jgi:putative ABC transport system permease protein
MIKNFFLTAWRNLVKNRAHTLLNIFGLALGVAVFLLIGVWLQRELSFDDFHNKGDQIFRISNTFKSESESFSQAGSGSALGGRLPAELPIIESSCRIFDEGFKLKYGEKQFIESGGLIADSNFFRFFGFKLLKGNANDVLLGPDKIVLTERLAKRYFGDEDPVGKTILMDGAFTMKVTGVAADAPVNSHIQFDLILPVGFLKKRAIDQWQFNIDDAWTGGWPGTYVKLKDGASPLLAEKQINEVVKKHSIKEWEENKFTYYYFLQPIKDIHLKSNLRYDASNNGSMARVKVFSIVGLIVLLLACINYVNLTTAGAIKRAKETSVRKVVGASKWQLVRQYFTETLLICTTAVLAGVMILKLVLPPFAAWIGQPYEFPLTLTNILLLLAFIVIIAGLAGIYPALMLTSFNPISALKGSFIQGTRGNFIRKSLVVFQFTITIGLIASMLIISRQMNFIKNKSLGFDDHAVVEVRFYGEAAVLNHYAAFRTRLLTSPHILNVTKHGQNVVGGLGNGWTTTQDLKGNEISTSLYQMNVDTTYKDTYSMKLVAGRFFTPSMPTDTTRSVLVNEAAVRTFGWGKPENAIGKRFGRGDNATYVIGVVKDFHFESLHKPVEALLIGYSRQGNRLSVKMNAANMDAALAHLQKEWTAAFPEIPFDYRFVEETIAGQYGNEQKTQGLFYAFAGLSLLIACLGLFGLSIFVVERKVKEIGIRKVLGASVSGIVGLLSKDFLKLVIIAALVATPLAWYFMHNWLQDFAYRISIPVWAFVVAGVSALAIALITVGVRAIKAAMVNPVKSLRTE